VAAANEEIEMTSVKHYEWTNGETGDAGRVALVVEGDKLSLVSLSRALAPIEVLFRVFEMDAELLEHANACEFTRKNPFCTRFIPDGRVFISSNVIPSSTPYAELRLYTLHSAKLRYAEMAARLYLYDGKVCDFSDIWLGDFPALLVAGMEAGLRQPHISVQEVDIFESDEWRIPRSLLLYTRDDGGLFYSDASRPWELSDEHGLPLPPMFWEDGHGELTPLLEDLQKFHSSSSWWELLEKLQGVKDPGLFTDSDFE